MRVVPVKARTDNWMYILIDETSNEAAAVDPYDAKKIIDEADSLGVKFTHLLTTHHHNDHSGGNAAFLKSYPVPVYGGSDQIPGLTEKMSEGSTFTIGKDISVSCIHTPCHTQDSICYFVQDKLKSQKSVFTGDTLFTAGCGRFFEGTGAEMHTALSKLMKLPNDTILYNGHEYTAGSAAFGASIEPENDKLKALLAESKTGKDMVGLGTIGDEKEWNVFVRVESDAVKKATKKAAPEDIVDVLREMKNKFRG